MDFLSFHGIVRNITNFSRNGCTKLFEVEESGGNIVNFIADSDTYFINGEKIYTGMPIAAFYEADDPVPLIYPPRYTALIIGTERQGRNIKVDYFNRELVSSDGALKLNISRKTEVILENGQDYFGTLRNRNLIVLYGTTTRSIPAQTTPDKIIVLCDED